MKYDIVGDGKADPEIAFLCPRLQTELIEKHYYKPHLSNLNRDVMVCNLYRDHTKKKTPAAKLKEYMLDLVPHLQKAGIKLLVVTQPDYFKVITKQTKTDATIGDVLPTIYGDDLHATYCPNYARIFYDPDKMHAKIKMALSAANRWMSGDTKRVGKGIIKFCAYPTSVPDILAWLDKLLKMDCDLTCDVETFSLKHYDAGIGTITFCWNKHEGVAFPIDFLADNKGHFMKRFENQILRKALRNLFERFERKMIYHNVCFDAYILIYQLFMDDILDQEGLLRGLRVMLKNWECTQLISYLATNSCAGNELGLKAQAQEFAGNYAVDEIKDIRKVHLPVLLEYNLIDGLSTWFVFEKNQPIMIADKQLNFYQEIFTPAVKDIIQMQLTGMPINMKKVKALDKQLSHESDVLLTNMNSLRLVDSFLDILKDELVVKKNASYKKKVITVDDLKADAIVFNPNSAPQLQRLLYDENFLGLPVLDRTDSKLPATGADTLEKLINHTKDPDVLALLGYLIQYKALAIINSTFIPAFLQAQKGSDGWHYLFGNFRLGGTLSGRLSSNNPNLQNIPSAGSSEAKRRLAKLIKECFEAPPGWLFIGLDFDSLEDKISAVTTRDPNKIKVYRDGYDGHCLRAYKYFSAHMVDIDSSSVESINSIKKKYKTFRQQSKAPTFALTYQGTYVTLMTNCGFSEKLAKSIEKNYHELYEVSDKYVNDRLEQASKDGYIEIAFGLRLRTPLLKQVVLGTSGTPYEAAAEGRTAGNAMGQSWCMLNSRAASEFLGKVRESDFRLDIKPCAHIHDAQYFLARDNIETLLYTNEHLVKAVSWQEDPLIQNEHIDMSGELSIFYPHWGHELVIPNGVSGEELKTLAINHATKLKEAA